MYPEFLIAPMREELTALGVRELKTAADVDRVVTGTKGTVMLIVNSVCGCAAGKARPGVALALRHPVKPDVVATVLRGGRCRGHGQGPRLLHRLSALFTLDRHPARRQARLHDGAVVHRGPHGRRHCRRADGRVRPRLRVPGLVGPPPRRGIPRCRWAWPVSTGYHDKVTGPGAEYARRLDARRRTHGALLSLDARLSHARLAVFGAGVVMTWGVFRGPLLPAAVLIVPVAAFLALVRWHASTIRRRDAAARCVVFYERGVARLEDRWHGGGEPGDRFREADHPYAADLDLFGEGSLFELLSIARTRAGEETLAGWLLAAAPPPAVRERQAAVQELAPALDFRETLALAGTDVRAAVLTDALTRWATGPARLPARWLWPLTALLTLASPVSIAAWLLGGPATPALAVVAAIAVFGYAMRQPVAEVLHGSDRSTRDLDVLAHALEHIERMTFASAPLLRIHRAVANGVTASRAIRRLHRLSEMHDWQHNMMFAPIAALLLWGPHLALLVERWRRRHGSRVPTWLAVVGELEALSSIATYRFEHPDDPFPELVTGPAAFEGERLGHPLLPAAKAVRNSVRLSNPTRLLVVSGSNMSGKSTLLRTVGINAVLALAGAPVRAASLRLTPVAIGATLRIQDSLQEGRSRFYAEITRVRRLSDMARGPVPLLFLLDELFHGTNSHDRLAGAVAVLRDLLDRGAIGLITTHDLALTAVAGDHTGARVSAGRQSLPSRSLWPCRRS